VGRPTAAGGAFSTRIAVITLSRGRPELLLGALASVQDQDVEASIDHVVVVDDCDLTEAALRELDDPRVRWWRAQRAPGERSGTARVGCLRNQAVRTVRAPWVAFLDDDNTWRADHLRSLLACAQSTGCAAVHSHRDLRTPEGEPYVEARFPWADDDEEGARQYLAAVTAGVMRPGSSLLCTSVDERLPPEFRFVDMGEWLLRRDVLGDAPFVEALTPDQDARRVGEDDLFLDGLLARGVSIACTGLPTLRYRLGGMSNRTLQSRRRPHGRTRDR
jgi:hypothetical protein